MLRIACSFAAACSAAVLLMAGLSAQASADSSCPDLNVCFWDRADFDGDRIKFDATDAGTNQPLGSHDRSAKNRFGSRRVRIKDVQFNVVWCLDAGENKDNLPASSFYFQIGATNTTC